MGLLGVIPRCRMVRSPSHYRPFLLQVEHVHLEQEAVIKGLTQHRDKVKDVHAAGPALRTQLQEVQELLKKMRAAGNERSERYEEAVAVERQVLTLMEEQRVDALRLGAPGRLLGAGLIEVLPLDDAVLLGKAKPVTPDGKVRIDAAAVRARNDAQVKEALKSGACSVLMLGGGHDLAPSVRRLSPTCGYLRVITKGYAAAMK